jgi:hypothetical protein
MDLFDPSATPSSHIDLSQFNYEEDTTAWFNYDNLTENTSYSYNNHQNSTTTTTTTLYNSNNYQSYQDNYATNNHGYYLASDQSNYYHHASSSLTDQLNNQSNSQYNNTLPLNQPNIPNNCYLNNSYFKVTSEQTQLADSVTSYNTDFFHTGQSSIKRKLNEEGMYR